MVLRRIFITGYQLPEVKPINDKAQDFEVSYINQIFPEKSIDYIRHTREWSTEDERTKRS